MVYPIPWDLHLYLACIHDTMDCGSITRYSQTMSILSTQSFHVLYPSYNVYSFGSSLARPEWLQCGKNKTNLSAGPFLATFGLPLKISEGNRQKHVISPIIYFLSAMEQIVGTKNIFWNSSASPRMVPGASITPKTTFYTIWLEFLTL